MESLIQEELPEIVNNGAFGKNIKYVSFELNKNYVGQFQYMSTVLFGTVITSDESQYHILLKLKLRDEKRRVQYQIDFQFHNEITMYERIIPFLFKCHRSLAEVEDWPSLARFFYGRNKCGEFFERDLIVLENVNPLGFRLSAEHPFIDYHHLISALKALAKFHGLSYTAKHKDPAGLQTTVSALREFMFDDDGQWTFKNNAIKRFGKRGVDRLLERSGDLYRDNEHLRRFNTLIGDGDNSLKRAISPREPLAVVCHGDFSRNNLLFRYDESGLPIDTLLFDFGAIRYGSPALDLSFFLYANTTQEMRACRWDDLLNAYCSTLVETVPSSVRVPNRAELDSEMAACAFSGFTIASFFLPHQLDPAASVCNVEMDDDERVEWFLTLGGDVGTDLVADMVQHMVDMEFTNV